MLKTVRDACVLQSNALEIRISGQIEQLDELIHTEGDGSGYFAKTHITQGMDQLMHERASRASLGSPTRQCSKEACFHVRHCRGGRQQVVVSAVAAGRAVRSRRQLLEFDDDAFKSHPDVHRTGDGVLRFAHRTVKYEPGQTSSTRRGTRCPPRVGRTIWARCGTGERWRRSRGWR